MKEHQYFVYILTNKNKTVLYTGVTNNLERRIIEHYFGKSSYTRKYNCYYLIYYEHYRYVSAAIDREKEIKGWKRDKKEALIYAENPNWEFWNNRVLGIWPPTTGMLTVYDDESYLS